MCVREHRLKGLRHSALLMGGIAIGPIPTAICLFFFISPKQMSFELEKSSRRIARRA